jgi:predicted dehydrogenase
MSRPTSNKHRVAIVGTGHRGTSMWGKELLAGWSDTVEMVGLCDINPVRLAKARDAMGASDAPVFTDFDAMLRETRPQRVIVCTPDSTHDDFIVRALEAGIDVITEKPLTTTAAKARRILDAQARTGGRIDVTFNYRYAPTATRIKQLLLDRVIGDITSVDFHWYLDTRHGADYFRRWHAYAANSGSLFVHKATHHFDLLNWYLASSPVRVFAQGDLKVYGRNGPFRGPRCKACPHAGTCDFHLDIGADPWLDMLYEEPSGVDGYLRDGCVFREDIDIPDTMSAAIMFENGVQVSYSLNAAMPVEGYHLAFNGTRGRIEVRQYEKQPWVEPPADQILLVRSFSDRPDRIWVRHAEGGHFGGDDRLRDMLFRPETADPLGQRAGLEAGITAMLTGAAAAESMQSGQPVDPRDLLRG